jgi:hypothetical protein
MSSTPIPTHPGGQAGLAGVVQLAGEVQQQPPLALQPVAQRPAHRQVVPGPLITPVHVDDPQGSNLVGPQPQPRHGQDDRVIPDPEPGIAVAGVQ